MILVNNKSKCNQASTHWHLPLLICNIPIWVCPINILHHTASQRQQSLPFKSSTLTLVHQFHVPHDMQKGWVPGLTSGKITLEASNSRYCRSAISILRFFLFFFFFSSKINAEIGKHKTCDFHLGKDKREAFNCLRKWLPLKKVKNK